MKKAFTWQIWFVLFLAGVSYAIIYSIPYIKYVFYDAMAAATGGNNTQLGLAMSIYGAGNLVSILIGGFVVDKFNYKTCILLSLVGTAALCVWLAIAPSINNVYVIWALMIITTLFVFDPAIFKITRMIVPEEQVSRSVGYFTMFQSIGYMLVNFLGLYIYDLTVEASGDIAQGFCNVIWLYGAMLVVCAVFCFSVGTVILYKGNLIIKKPKPLKKDSANDSPAESEQSPPASPDLQQADGTRPNALTAEKLPEENLQ